MEIKLLGEMAKSCTILRYFGVVVAIHDLTLVVYVTHVLEESRGRVHLSLPLIMEILGDQVLGDVRRVSNRYAGARTLNLGHLERLRVVLVCLRSWSLGRPYPFYSVCATSSATRRLSQ